MADRTPMTPARRTQLIVGVGISLWTGFWLWLPAGLLVGLAAGAIMRPPSE